MSAFQKDLGDVDADEMLVSRIVQLGEVSTKIVICDAPDQWCWGAALPYILALANCDAPTDDSVLVSPVRVVSNEKLSVNGRQGRVWGTDGERLR